MDLRLEFKLMQWNIILEGHKRVLVPFKFICYTFEVLLLNWSIPGVMAGDIPPFFHLPFPWQAERLDSSCVFVSRTLAQNFP